MPMSAEPRFTIASAVHVGANQHRLTHDLAIQIGYFIDFERWRRLIPADAVLIKAQPRVQLCEGAPVGADRLDDAAHVGYLLVRGDAGFRKCQREWLAADAFVAEPVGFRCPITDPMAPGLALDPIDLVHLPL